MDNGASCSGSGSAFGEWVNGARLIVGSGLFQIVRAVPGARYEITALNLTLPRLALWCGAIPGEAAAEVMGGRFVGAVVRDALGAVVVVSVPVGRWGDFVELVSGAAGGELVNIAAAVEGWCA